MRKKSCRNQNGSVIRYLESVKKEFGEETLFVCGCEAGPTGFSLYRDLAKAGYSCVVMAPTSLKHPASHKVKNDKADARYLARTLFTKDYSSVHVTTEHGEAIKEFCRMRLCLKADLKKAKQQLSSFLLRQDRKYTDGETWTLRHRTWNNEVGGQGIEAAADRMREKHKEDEPQGREDQEACGKAEGERGAGRGLRRQVQEKTQGGNRTFRAEGQERKYCDHGGGKGTGMFCLGNDDAVRMSEL